MERILIKNPDTVQAEPKLNAADFLVIQCIVEGWTDREISALGINPIRAKEQIVGKMQDDDSLDRFLAGVESLPFTPKNLFSPRESMVSFLVDANFQNGQIGKMLRIDHSAVKNYVMRLEKKKEQQRDRDIPKVGLLHDHNMRVGLARGIYVALREGQINTQIIDAEPSAMLSYNESRVLFLMCAGMTFGEIAQTLHRSVGTVDTYNRRIGAKLGVTKKSPMIAKGLVEMMSGQKKNNPE